MYSLDDQLNRTHGQDRGVGVFRPGVNIKFMTLKQQANLQFRVLPAFDPTTMQIKDGLYVPMDLTSWVPFRDPQSHTLQTFARPIKVATFIGHGKGRDGRRRDLLSPATFDAGDQDAQPLCPLTMLFRAAENDPEWMYLTTDTMSADGKFPTARRVLSFPSWQMLANVVDVQASQLKVELGVFTTSAYNSLLGNRGDTLGLVHQLAAITDPAILAQNPMYRYACGDLTNPTNGPILTLTKATGPFGKYGMQLACDSTNQVLTLPITDQLLEQRYNLYQLESIVVRYTEEEIIHELVKLLNGVSPSGQHEWIFLKKTFGHLVGKDVIPDPPANGYTQGYSAPAAAPAAVPAAVPPPAAAPAAVPGAGAPPSPEIPVANLAPAVDSPEQRLVNTAAASNVPPPAAVPGAVPGAVPAAAPPPAVAPAAAGQKAPLPGDPPPPGYSSSDFVNRLRDANQQDKA